MRTPEQLILIAALGIGCGHSPSGPDAGGDAGMTDAIADVGTYRQYPDASCFVRIDAPPVLPGNHVPTTTDITTWDSNPPSSGDHYPVWAAYQEYDAAVPRGYYVHDLEHGAIDFLYNCALYDAGPCDTLVQSLRDAIATLADDPSCSGGARVRFVLTPDPLIDRPVAAASWGFTYVATCADLPTLEAFVNAHYAKSPENTCANGITSF